MTDVLRLCALYPDLMNIYADRGNILVLQRRCEWRGLRFELTGAGLREGLDPESADIFYIGGGQDRDQRLCAEDLVATKQGSLEQAAGAGKLVLGICGGFQLLGHSYQLGSESLPGLGLVDLRTVREDGPRLIGNAAITVSLPGLDGERTLAGFENHGGRTYLGEGEAPLGRIVAGHGNNGKDGTEGVVRDGVIGTYLHGPLLPKNTWFADWLIARGLGLSSVAELPPLDDDFEAAAHASARAAAGV